MKLNGNFLLALRAADASASKSKEYLAGREAFYASLNNNVRHVRNPYTGFKNRTRWFAGYRAARMGFCEMNTEFGLAPWKHYV